MPRDGSSRHGAGEWEGDTTEGTCDSLEAENGLSIMVWDNNLASEGCGNRSREWIMDSEEG